ncbi:MAG: carboxymuconolactone decarboxylase family protein [Pyrinomonadaceae bacterium]
MSLSVQTIESAPEKSAAILKEVGAKFGFVPNLMGVFANSPEALQGYLTLSALVDQTSLSPAERQIVLLGVSESNSCDYCMAAHTTIASMQRIDPAVVQAVRSDSPIADTKLEALRLFTKSVVEKRGYVSEEEKDAFLAAGYTGQNILEVILGVAMKTLSNYTNHIAGTPLDNAFEPAKWHKAAA